ncbi:MAG: hypothetical protein HY551_07230 [Elusimicrobia bacterium]|nr:hypothetical protein [Elusimicrobiota bacterium]
MTRRQEPRKAPGRAGQRSPAPGPDMATLLRKHPRLLRVLHEYGVNFCAGCYLTLSATPEKAAAYHGVPDIPEFVARVRRVVSPSAARKHSRRHRNLRPRRRSE